MTDAEVAGVREAAASLGYDVKVTDDGLIITLPSIERAIEVAREHLEQYDREVMSLTAEDLETAQGRRQVQRYWRARGRLERLRGRRDAQLYAAAVRRYAEIARSRTGSVAFVIRQPHRRSQRAVRRSVRRASGQARSGADPGDPDPARSTIAALRSEVAL